MENLEKYQKLYPFKNLLTEEELEMFKQRKLYNTSFLYSIFLEPFFKDLVDQYVRKVPMNGYIKKSKC